MSAGKSKKSDDKEPPKEEELAVAVRSSSGSSNVVWNSALFYAANSIVQWANRKELGTFALINKDWYNITSLEAAKRYFIQHFPLNYDIEKDLAFPTASSMLQIKPEISLLIYDERLVKLYQKWLLKNEAYNLEPDICKRLLDYFKNDVPNKLMAMKVTEVVTSNDTESNCGLVGIFFPNMEQRNRIEVAYLPYDPSAIKAYQPCVWIAYYAHLISKKLDLYNLDNPKSCILILAHSIDSFAAQCVFRLKTTIPRIEEKKDDIWIGQLTRSPTQSCSNPGSPQNQMKLLVAMKITGPNIASCTAIIDLSQPPDVVRNKLIELRNKITLKRYRTGLISGPSKNKKDEAFENSDLIMNAVKEIFPTVPFVGLFTNRTPTHLAYLASPMELKAIDKNLRKFIRVHYRWMSIVIITYD